MNISACTIAWNEEETLPYTLKFLSSIPEVTEVNIVVDAECTDGTLEIANSFPMNKVKNVVIRQFDNFANQKNAALNMVTGDWILWIDSDEVYTNFNVLITVLEAMPHINAVRIPSLPMHTKTKIFLRENLDPHIRLWKRDMGAFYQNEIHEILRDKFNRDLHSWNDPDILNSWSLSACKYVYMKHYQLIKSDKALKEKGKKWKPFFKDSADRGIPIYEEFWYERKYKDIELYGVADLPDELYDITTLWEYEKGGDEKDGGKET